MAQRKTEVGPTGRLFGHGFGVLGAVIAISAVLSLVNPHFLKLFPWDSSDLQQGSAGLFGFGLFLLGAWLHFDGTSRRRPQKSRLRG